MIRLEIFAALALLVSGGSAPPLAGQDKSAVEYTKSGYDAVIVPEDVELLEEKILPLDAAPLEIGMNMHNTHKARGFRTFLVTIRPGQTLKATLKATPISAYLINWVLLEDKKNPLYSKVKLASENQLTRKAPFISMKNTTTQPQQIIISLSGLADNPYSIKLERK